MLALVNFLYLSSCTMMIMAIRLLASPKTARIGNALGFTGILAAIIGTLLHLNLPDTLTIVGIISAGGLIGIYSGIKVKIASLPQMIAVFNGLGGLAAVCIAISETLSLSTAYIDNSIGLVIGGITFSGSLVAFAKLQGIISGKSIRFPFQYTISIILAFFIFLGCIHFTTNHNILVFYNIAIFTIILGVLLLLPIGGADMPIAISILNACSGWAAVGIGLSLNTPILIIIGTIVGAGGSILAYIMMKSMNRSLLNILTGGFSKSDNNVISSEKTVRIGSPQDAAFIMENASKIIIVPGYGMAAAQAQHALKRMTEILHNKYNVDIKFAIHPVAGRMPGHMNVLLAEANIDYKDVYEISDINNEFSSADVAYIIGANDITNPSAKNDISSPLYGMPILEVEKAKTIFFVKRSLASGYSGVDNPLFYAPNTTILYGDAKEVTEKIIKSLEEN